MIHITIDGTSLNVRKQTTILKAANLLGIDIPTLCFIEGIHEEGNCRMCVVEIKGKHRLVSACNTRVTPNMDIRTHSKRVLQSRQTTLELLASKHHFDCWDCPKEGHCSFYDLLQQYNITYNQFSHLQDIPQTIIKGTAISQDPSKCILCNRCVSICDSVVGAHVLHFHNEDGVHPFVSPTVGQTFDQAQCISCGLCIEACPTGSLFATSYKSEVHNILTSQQFDSIVQLDRRTINTIQTTIQNDPFTTSEVSFGHINKALTLLGFNQVTTLDLGEDYYGLLLGQELYKRLNTNSPKLPVLTTTCSAATRYIEQHQPEYAKHLSPFSSVHDVQAGLLKYHVLKGGTKPLKVVTISDSPALKNELHKHLFDSTTNITVDAVLTTDELIAMMHQKGIDFEHMEQLQFTRDITASKPQVQGGMIAAALQVVAHQYNDRELQSLILHKTFQSKLGKGSIQEAIITIKGKRLRVAKATGGNAIREILQRVQDTQYHLIELSMSEQGFLEEEKDNINMSFQSQLPLSNPRHNATVLTLYNDIKDQPIYLYRNQEEGQR